MRKVKTGERAPFWCTLIVFTRADGQCFMPPLVVHQAKYYPQDIHHNIPFDWTVHHTQIYLTADKVAQCRKMDTNRRETEGAKNITANKTGTRKVNLQLKISEAFDRYINSMNSPSSSITDEERFIRLI